MRKENLSIDNTFDHRQFSLDSTFKQQCVVSGLGDIQICFCLLNSSVIV
jgi:hypothetical protein